MLSAAGKRTSAREPRILSTFCSASRCRRARSVSARPARPRFLRTVNRGSNVTYDIKAIDAVCNYEFDDNELRRPEWSKTFITEKIGADPSAVAGYTDKSFIEKMDRAGIEHVFLIAVKAGSAMHKIHRHISYERVAAMVKKHPTRFSGLAGVDPTEGMKGLARLEYAIRELGFVGAHLYPHWFEMPPDHARYYPIYAKCAELGVPIQMQVGHCLRYSEERPLQSVGRPITLDTIACHFPELKLIGIHIG